MPSAPRTAVLVRLTILLTVIIAGTIIPASTSTSEKQTNPPQAHSSGNLSARPLATPLPTSQLTPQAPSRIPPATYDEQIGTTFVQNFTRIVYNVTAVAQADSNGYGPAYLVNGLTPHSYWYQAGLAYDWPIIGGGYNPGFSFLFQVFNSTGQVVWPASGGGGLAPFNGPVNNRDKVLLTLNFTNGAVIMAAKDVNTNATANTSYTALSDAKFVGLSSTFEQNGFFTGLMTEWYHAAPYLSDEGPVTYTNSHATLTSEWMWMDEFNPFTNTGVFHDNTTTPVSFTNPGQFQSFASNGASETGDATTLVTGMFGCGATIALTPNTVVCDGTGPTTIGLTWGRSEDPQFTSYLVQKSTTSSTGPWIPVDTIRSQTNTTDYINGLSSNTTYWWRIEDIGKTIITTTNVLQIKQPTVASLSTKVFSDTNYRFSWNNNANYNGTVTFSSYVLEESINNGAYVIIFSGTSVSTTSFNQTLSPSTKYTLYLITTDKCTTCSTPLASNSTSAIVAIQTVPTLLVSISIQPASLDLGQIVSFTCSATGGSQPYNYTWTFGDGQTANGRSVSHYYTQTGTEIAFCSVVDSLTSTALKILPITIFSDPTVSLTVDHSSVDIGQTYTLTAQASGGSGGYRYAWANVPPNCATRADASTLYCQATIVNTYQIVVSATDSNSYTAKSNPLTITIFPDPIITKFTASKSSLDVDQTLNFTTIAFDGAGPLSYVYSGLPTGCATSNQNILTCTPSGAGTFSIKVIVTDSNNYAVVSNPFQLTVNPSPEANINASPSTDLSLGQDLTLSVTVTQGVGPFTYSYSGLPPGCPSDNSSTIRCTPAVAGSWLITASITDKAGETDNATVAVSVFEPNQVASLSDTELTAMGGVAVLVLTGTFVLMLRARTRKTKPSVGP